MYFVVWLSLGVALFLFFFALSARLLVILSCGFILLAFRVPRPPPRPNKMETEMNSSSSGIASLLRSPHIQRFLIKRIKWSNYKTKTKRTQPQSGVASGERENEEEEKQRRRYLFLFIFFNFHFIPEFESCISVNLNAMEQLEKRLLRHTLET